jgi:hypothetical protein
MNENPNRRKDDARPAVALQWGDRPDQWTLLLTGPTSGVIGPLGSTWPNHPPQLERVDVCVRRKDAPAAVFRTGGEGANKWEQFYPYDSIDQPLRDGEYLYREGAAPKLDDIEQYRLQMAAIGTASFGYWKEGDGIHPDYDTMPLRDVARLYAKYEALHAAQPSAAARDVIAERRRQVDQEGYAPEHDEEHKCGEIAAYAAFFALPPDARAWPATETGYGDTFGEAIVPHDWPIPKDGDRRRELVKAGALILAEIERLDRAAAPALDAVEAALKDAVIHGTGAFTVKADGSTEHVDLQAQNRAAAEIVAFSPPAGVRDALYRDYVVPTKDGDPA